MEVSNRINIPPKPSIAKRERVLEHNQEGRLDGERLLDICTCRIMIFASVLPRDLCVELGVLAIIWRDEKPSRRFYYPRATMLRENVG